MGGDSINRLFAWRSARWFILALAREAAAALIEGLAAGLHTACGLAGVVGVSGHGGSVGSDGGCDGAGAGSGGGRGRDGGDLTRPAVRLAATSSRRCLWRAIAMYAAAALLDDERAGLAGSGAGGASLADRGLFGWGGRDVDGRDVTSSP